MDPLQRFLSSVILQLHTIWIIKLQEPQLVRQSAMRETNRMKEEVMLSLDSLAMLFLIAWEEFLRTQSLAERALNNPFLYFIALVDISRALWAVAKVLLCGC